MASFQWFPSWKRRHHQHKTHRRDRDFSEEDLNEGSSSFNPVLLIPGIGGSILSAVSNNGKKAFKERIWVRLYLADQEFRRRLWSKFNPATGKSESLDPDTHIEVPDDRFGLYSCDTLDPDFAFSVDAVNYYHNMIAEMHKWGFVDGQDLFGFGYDFRQSNRHPETMEMLLKKLQSIYAQTGKKVDVVTHSMGGLLFKSFVALHYHEVAQLVNKWVAIAAPFRGAPGFITDTILTGVEFLKGWESYLFISKWSMHQLLVECPSVYELMTDYSYDWETLPELRIVHTDNNGDAVQEDAFRDRHSVLSVMERILRENCVVVNGDTIPLPLNKDIVTLAKETHALWNTTKLPESVEFFSIYGINLDTPYHSQYGTQDKPVKDLTEILHTDVLFDFKDGDGTVPVESALGDGFKAMYRVGVPGEHRALLSDGRVHRILNYFLKIPPHDELYDPYTDCIFLPSKEEIEREMEAMRHRRALPSLVDVDQRDERFEEVTTTVEDIDDDLVEVCVSTMPEQSVVAAKKRL